MSTRDSFAAIFGEDQAAAIEAAAEGHKNGVHDNPGSDHFKWALCITIGHECFTKYASGHGITADPETVKAWIKEHADLASHDGDFDYLAALVGAYDEYMPTAEPAS